jgi:hypothetical protein
MKAAQTAQYGNRKKKKKEKKNPAAERCGSDNTLG